jgi:hypothetical protein
MLIVSCSPAIHNGQKRSDRSATATKGGENADVDHDQLEVQPCVTLRRRGNDNPRRERRQQAHCGAHSFVAAAAQ